MVKLIQIFIIAIGISVAGIPAAASAYSIAVLPATDLAHGPKGLNPVFTSQLIKQLRQQGLEVVEPHKVIEFMVQQGLRRCDNIDSFTARKMASSLKCDSLLLTTLYRQKLIRNQSNLILTLLHGKNGQPVWSKVASMHVDDVQPLFGFKKKRDLPALQALQIKTVAQQFIDELPSLPKVKTHELSSIQITNIHLSQSLIKSESPINCRLKIDFLGLPPDRLLLRGGLQPIQLQRTDKAHTYTGTFLSKVETGEHKLKLVAHWSHQQEETIASLASYKVANQPPQLTISFRNGIKLGDTQAFSRGIKIIPKMAPPHQLDLWRITISDADGNIVFSETRHTPLPQEMHWKGTNSNNRELDSGYYTLLLTIRDIAGNEAQKTSNLYLQSTKMELANVQQHIERGQHRLELLPTTTMLVPIDNWVLTLETKTGETKFTQTGTRLPATITIPDHISEQKLFCYLLIKDKLGNHYTTTNTQLKTANKAGILAQIEPPQNNWKADF